MIYEGHRDQIFGPTSYSQHGEDLFILGLCRLLKIETPTYLDLGAHHPTAISNTALLYERGCTGVNVEANIRMMEYFVEKRPRDVNVNVAVGVKYGMAPFYTENLYSVLNSLDPNSFDHHNTCWTERENVLVMTLNQIVEQYCCDGKFPDILLMDIEEMDLPVLEVVNFSDSKPKIICAEIRQDQGVECRSIMLQKGYAQVCRIVSNLIFVQMSDYEKIV